MTDEELGEHVKEVFAHFGAALYHTQVLEHGIVNALVVVDLIPARKDQVGSRQEWARILDGFMDQHFSKPMGRMMEALRMVATIPDDLETMLTEALQRRNWLAHHFFRERADAFLSVRGRDQMISELRNATSMFVSTDQCLEELTRPLRVAAGLTDEMIEQALQESRVRSRDS